MGPMTTARGYRRHHQTASATPAPPPHPHKRPHAREGHGAQQGAQSRHEMNSGMHMLNGGSYGKCVYADMHAHMYPRGRGGAARRCPPASGRSCPRHPTECHCLRARARSSAHAHPRPPGQPTSNGKGPEDIVRSEEFRKGDRRVRACFVPCAAAACQISTTTQKRTACVRT